MTYRSATATVIAVDGVDLDIRARQAVGLLGESGSGKSSIAAATLALRRAGADVTGDVAFEGRNLLALSARELREVRGAKISFVAQDPAASLCPVLRVGEQIADVLRAHIKVARRTCRERVDAALAEVGFREVERIRDSYPHQLSGGQRQRIAIAQALICSPALLVADEPTTALDVTTQADVLALLRRLRGEREMAMLLVSHDPAVLAEMVEYVYVIRGGRVVEHGPADRVLTSPEQPYTRSLIDASRRLEAFANA